MNDTPGWASPGSAPSDGREPDAPDLPGPPTVRVPSSPPTGRSSRVTPRGSRA